MSDIRVAIACAGAVLALMAGSVFVNWLAYRRPVIGALSAGTCLLHMTWTLWHGNVLQHSIISLSWLFEVFYVMLYLPALIGNWQTTRQRRLREERQYAKIQRLLNQQQSLNQIE
jgi:hypothetical protein